MAFGEGFVEPKAALSLYKIDYDTMMKSVPGYSGQNKACEFVLSLFVALSMIPLGYVRMVMTGVQGCHKILGS